MAHDKFYGICENKCLVEINADRVGAAGTEHTHSADDITTGVLSLERGGTGGGTATEIREVLEVEKEYVLYENTSGTTGTITLPEPYTNFKKITVVHSALVKPYMFSDTFFPGFKDGLMLNESMTTDDASKCTWLCVGITFSDTTVTQSFTTYWNSSLNAETSISTNTPTYIYKIIGYKY